MSFIWQLISALDRAIFRLWVPKKDRRDNCSSSAQPLLLEPLALRFAIVKFHAHYSVVNKCHQ